MSDYEKDVELTEALFEFLQGRFPEEKFRIAEANIPRLTPEQAETVIWYLGNLYWQVTDHVERCEVCGDWYNTWSEGETNDHAPGPIFVCGNCVDSEEAVKQRRIGRKLEKQAERAHRIHLANDSSAADRLRRTPQSH